MARGSGQVMAARKEMVRKDGEEKRMLFVRRKAS